MTKIREDLSPSFIRRIGKRAESSSPWSAKESRNKSEKINACNEGI
jgi:hypothetical protein